MATAITRGVEFIVGSRAANAAASTRVAEHDGPVWLETMGSAIAEKALLAHADAGGEVNLLSNRRHTFSMLPVHPGVRAVDYDSGEWDGIGFQHSKLLYFEPGPRSHARPELWVTNYAKQDPRDEVTAVIRGEAAARGGEVLKATMALDARRITTAVDDAAEAGVLVNEPMAGRFPYAAAELDLLGNARRRLDVWVKEITDPEAVRLLYAGQRRADRSSVAARTARVPRESGTGSRPIGFRGGLIRLPERYRTNFVFADGRATLGTAFLDPDMLGRTSYPTRDSGLLLGGAAARHAREAVARLVGVDA